MQCHCLLNGLLASNLQIHPLRLPGQLFQNQVHLGDFCSEAFMTNSKPLSTTQISCILIPACLHSLSLILWHSPCHMLCSSCFQLYPSGSSICPYSFLCLGLNHHSLHPCLYSTLPLVRYCPYLRPWLTISSSWKLPITSLLWTEVILPEAGSACTIHRRLTSYLTGSLPGWEHNEARGCVLLTSWFTLGIILAHSRYSVYVIPIDLKIQKCLCCRQVKPRLKSDFWPKPGSGMQAPKVVCGCRKWTRGWKVEWNLKYKI